MSEPGDSTAAAGGDTTTGSDRIHVCTLDDLPEVGAVCADINGRRVAIARDSEGVVHAVDDTCSHANVSLAEGDIDGSTIECWLHGSRFDLTTGEPTGLPAIIPIAVHSVQLQGQDVYVTLRTEGMSPVTPPTTDLLSHPSSSQQGAPSA